VFVYIQNKQGQFPQILINVEVFKFTKNPTLRIQNSEAYDDWMERNQGKVQRNAKPAYGLLVCSQVRHMSCSNTCHRNGTSFLAATCPCKNQVGWPFRCPFRNVDVPAYKRAESNPLRKATCQY